MGCHKGHPCRRWWEGPWLGTPGSWGSRNPGGRGRKPIQVVKVKGRRAPVVRLGCVLLSLQHSEAKAASQQDPSLKHISKGLFFFFFFFKPSAKGLGFSPPVLQKNCLNMNSVKRGHPAGLAVWEDFPGGCVLEVRPWEREGRPNLGKGNFSQKALCVPPPPTLSAVDELAGSRGPSVGAEQTWKASLEGRELERFPVHIHLNCADPGARSTGEPPPAGPGKKQLLVVTQSGRASWRR